MATKLKRRHGKRKMTIPLAIVGGFIPLAVDVGTQIQGGSWKQAFWVVEHNLTGINQWNGSKFDTQGFSHGLYPIAAGFGIHWLAQKLGINRMIAGSGIPLIRI